MFPFYILKTQDFALTLIWHGFNYDNMIIQELLSSTWERSGAIAEMLWLNMDKDYYYQDVGLETLIQSRK